MPPKKGPSAEEKRRMLQEKVMASKSFFNAKELEKMAAGVGISGMIFKKELQTMIDEDMIVCEKIGGGNFYWKLPGDAANALNKVRTQMHPAHLASQFVRSFRGFTGWPREVGMLCAVYGSSPDPSACVWTYR